MSVSNLTATAQILNLELAVLESEFTMARRFQDGIVNALSAGNVPEAATVDDLYRFLRELARR